MLGSVRAGSSGRSSCIPAQYVSQWHIVDVELTAMIALVVQQHQEAGLHIVVDLATCWYNTHHKTVSVVGPLRKTMTMLQWLLTWT